MKSKSFSNITELLKKICSNIGGLVSLHVDYMGGISSENSHFDPEEELIPQVKLKGDRVSSFLVYVRIL